MNNNQFLLLASHSAANDSVSSSKLNSKNITHRELEILKLIAYEHTNLEIAHKLYISFHTVDTHRKSLYRKFNVKNTAGLIRRAFELSYLQVTKPIDQN
jgi:DNA-binding CsgD family transcriptional regulator